MDKYKNVTKLNNDKVSQISGGKAPLSVYKGRKPHFKHPMNINAEMSIKHSEMSDGQEN